MACLALVFALFSGGEDPSTRERTARALIDGRLELSRVPGALRALFSDDADVARYFAYSNAALGRPPAPSIHPAPEGTVPAAGASAAPLMPYRDFPVEYPPGVFLWILPPAGLASTGAAYEVMFSIWMALLLTGAGIVACRCGALLSGRPVPALPMVAFGAAAVLAGGAMIIHRFDAAIALTMTLCIWAALAGRPLVLGAALGVSVASKLVPCLLAPLLALHLIRQRRWRDLLVASAAALLVGAALLLPIPGSAAGLLHVLRYHGQRPPQLESTAAALWGLGAWLAGARVQFIHSFGSSNVTGPGVGAILLITTLASLLSFCAAYAWTWRRLAASGALDDWNTHLVEGTMLVLVLYMVCGKVFSPQYLVWLLPLGLMLSLRRGGLAPWGLLVVLGLTQLIFPGIYSRLEAMRPWAFGLVLVRNGLLLAWVCYLVSRPAEDHSCGESPPLGA